MFFKYEIIKIMEANIQQSQFLKIVTVVKVYGKSRYGLLAIISLFTLTMTGYVVVLSMNKKTPPQTIVTHGLQKTSPTSAPTIATTFQLVATPSSTISPTSTPTDAPTINPLAGWYTYTNSQYGYTIKYPPDWRVQDLGALEPKIPSYIVFNQNSATTSARSITISVSTRTYQEQLAIGSQTGSPIIVGSITGTLQFLQDSDRQQSSSVILPRANNLLILHTKTTYANTFNQMLTTVKFTN
jgi:hypothetical protein